MSANSASKTLSTRDVHRSVLDNGLVLLMREVHTAPTVASMVWYGVGSRNEGPGETGRSHLLEHMLFKGTQKLKKGEIDLLTMRNGGSNNAFTSQDFTAYYFSFASDRWQRALDIEADRMVNTVFDSQEFELEKKVVIEELKASLDQPWGFLMQELSASAFECHPYRNPVVGWLEDVESTTRDDLELYYRKHYYPGNATLVLVGDFKAEEALAKVVDTFGSIPRKTEPADIQIEEPAQRAEKRINLSWPSDLSRVAIAYHAPEIRHKDSYALQLLAAILTEGKSSRLYQRMVEREQVATFAVAEYGESLDPTLFHIRVECRGGHSPEEVEGSLNDELYRIATNGVSGHELSRAKHQVEAHFILTRERNLDQAILLGQIATLDTLDYVDNYLSRMGAVDSSTISDVCRQYLSEYNRTVGLLLPENGGETVA